MSGRTPARAGRRWAVAAALAGVTSPGACAEPSAVYPPPVASDTNEASEGTEPRPAPARADAEGFAAIAGVLQSPRCAGCHPAGDRPLQHDAGLPHAMNISRLSTASGLECAACHQEVNADALGVAGGPPGAPHWELPPASTPMTFEGLSIPALCRQLRDPQHNGGRSLTALLTHVTEDPLVLWGWSPGGTRRVPPLPHAEFVEVFAAWVRAGGPCPGDSVGDPAGDSAEEEAEVPDVARPETP